jgi:dTDP-4-dehydrorhamnose 3,5-epimerase
MLYVPEGFAHGYQALTPDTEVFYMASAFYAPTHERACRWNDPALGIKWPIENPILSPKDAAHENYQP